MSFEKQQVIELGDAVFKVGYAFSDGVQLSEDSAAMMAVIPALMSAANEFQEDLPSALMYLGSQLMRAGADLRRQQAETPPVA